MSPYQDAYGEITPYYASTEMTLDPLRYEYLQHIWNDDLLVEEINHKRLTQDKYYIPYYF